MFDINNIVNAAINAAVNARLTEVLQQHANTIAPLMDQIHNLDAICQTQAERITALEFCNAEHHQRLLVLEGALTDRVVALENQAIVTSNAVDARIAALENNPAQGVDTQAAPAIDKAALIDYLNEQEWFWEKLQNRIDSTVEAAMDDHTSTYDHDDYDSAVSKVDDLPDLDDCVTRDEVRSEIEDVLNNATLSLSI